MLIYHKCKLMYDYKNISTSTIKRIKKLYSLMDMNTTFSIAAANNYS